MSGGSGNMRAADHLQSTPDNATEYIAEPQTTFQCLIGQLYKLRERILVKR